MLPHRCRRYHLAPRMAQHDADHDRKSPDTSTWSNTIQFTDLPKPVYPIYAAYMLPVTLYVYFKYGKAAAPVSKSPDAEEGGLNYETTPHLIVIQPRPKREKDRRLGPARRVAQPARIRTQTRLLSIPALKMLLLTPARMRLPTAAIPTPTPRRATSLQPLACRMLATTPRPVPCGPPSSSASPTAVRAACWATRSVNG